MHHPRVEWSPDQITMLPRPLNTDSSKELILSKLKREQGIFASVGFKIVNKTIEINMFYY